MTKSSQEFRFRSAFGAFFDKQITSSKKKDSGKVTLAKELVDFLLEGNIGVSESLRHEYQGKRSHRKGKIRVIFAHCEECRRLGHQENNSCEECADNTDDTLRFFAFGDRDEIYEILSKHQIWRAPRGR